MIVSPPEIHDFLDVAIVAPMTTGSRPAGFRVPIKFAGKNGLVLLEQIRALDKSRSPARPDGRLNDVWMEKIAEAIRFTMGV